MTMLKQKGFSLIELLIAMGLRHVYARRYYPSDDWQ